MEQIQCNLGSEELIRGFVTLLFHVQVIIRTPPTVRLLDRLLLRKANCKTNMRHFEFSWAKGDYWQQRCMELAVSLKPSIQRRLTFAEAVERIIRAHAPENNIQIGEKKLTMASTRKYSHR